MSTRTILIGFALSSLALSGCYRAADPDEPMADTELSPVSAIDVPSTEDETKAGGKADAGPMGAAIASVAGEVTPDDQRVAGDRADANEGALANLMGGRATSTTSMDPTVAAPMGGTASAAPEGRQSIGDVADAAGGEDEDAAEVFGMSTRSPLRTEVAATRRPAPKKPDSSRTLGQAEGRSGGSKDKNGVGRGDTTGHAGLAREAAPVDAPIIAEVVPDSTSTTERFTDHGVNPFTLVEKDAHSTFSIDVDTASYSVARRMLDEQNSLPLMAAVRVEEFVNYFDYGYTAPKDDPFAVNMEAMPDPFRPGHHILRVGVQGREIGRDQRQPVHLTFLVDVSGSMSSADKLDLAKKSLHMMVDGLREDDTVGLATYAGATRRVLEPTSAANKQAIHQAIEDLQAGGSTAMSSGIDIAYDMATQSFEPGHENRVVVLSDGDANVGSTSWDEMLGQIKGHADRGVTLSTIGFGMGNYQDTLMEQLANKGDGNNFYIDNRAQAQRVFVEELGGTMLTIARDVKIQVEFNEESVSAYRLVGYENRDIADRDFRNDRVDAGEVGSGHNVTALYEVVLKDGYTRELATVRMRYEQPGPDGIATEKAWTFQDSRLKETPWLASRDSRIAYSAATFAEVLRGSPNAAEIDLEALAQFTEKSQRSGKMGKDDQELVSLIRKAHALGAGGGSMVSVR